MIFYSYEFTLNGRTPRDMNEKEEIKAEMAKFPLEYSEKLGRQAFVAFDACGKNNRFKTFAVYNPEFFMKHDHKKTACDFVGVLFHEAALISDKEITQHDFISLYTRSVRRDYLDDADDFIRGNFHVDMRFSGRLSDGYREYLLEDKRSSEDKKCGENYDFCCKETLLPELERINAKHNSQNVLYNPVHYTIRTSDKKTSEEIVKSLLTALCENGRLLSRRYCVVDLSEDPDSDDIANLYRDSFGAAIVIIAESEKNTDEFASSCDGLLNDIIELNEKYPQVLTIYCIDSSDISISERIKEQLVSTVLVDIREDIFDETKALVYLRRLADRYNVSADTDLEDCLKICAGKDVATLNKGFELWYGRYARQEAYPAYSDFKLIEKAEPKPKGNAYDKLNNMVGLTEAKEVLKNALDYYKAQKLFSEFNVSSKRTAMHMVFTGNPGTAKTSVARLFAKILYDNGVIPRDICVEVGRSDLVGKYVGWTAPAVQSRFRAAEGGVLFIDEAYSLVDDRSGMYGDEAINTIVQEMENRRNDVIVIFAGYKDEMNVFLDRNPGLSSRIAFHVNFPDYSAEELVKIADIIAAENDRVLNADAKEALGGIFNAASKTKNFGNGRCARNVIEKAMMKQSTRLLSVGYENWTNEDVHTLSDADFDAPKQTDEMKKAIGF